MAKISLSEYSLIEGGQTPEQRIRKIETYLRILHDELMYELGHIDADNISGLGSKAVTQGTLEERMREAGGRIDGLQRRMTAAEAANAIQVYVDQSTDLDRVKLKFISNGRVQMDIFAKNGYTGSYVQKVIFAPDYIRIYKDDGTYKTVTLT